MGHAPAWFGHFIIEGNRPATFKHPLWSLRGDLRMLAYAVRGKIGEELERLHVLDEPKVEAGPVKEQVAPAPVAAHVNGATA